MANGLKVGLIGVGLMGHGIAMNLLRAGHVLTFLDHPGNQQIDDLLAQGAKSRASPAEVAGASQVVILCVTGTPEVEAVLFESNGVLEGLQPGAIVIDCSTAIPSSTIKIAEKVASQGGRFSDAAMTRTPKEAAEGRLNLIVGAPQSLFAEITPLLESFAENITHVGPVGAGHQVKLLHNFVSLGFSAVLAEAAATARRAGVSAEAFTEVLSKGGGAGVVLDRLTPFLLHDDPSGFHFSMANAMKDMGYYDSMAEEYGASHVVASAIEALYREAGAKGNETALVPELVRILAHD